MSGNSEQPGKPGTPPAQPVKVVRPAPAAPAAPAAAPAKKAAAPRVTPPAPAAAAPVKKAPAKQTPAKPAPAAPAAQAARPAPAPAPAKQAPAAAPATARQTSPLQPAAPQDPAKQAPAADDTAVRPGFGARLKEGLAKAATFTAAYKGEAATSYAAVSGADDRPSAGAGRSPRRARLRLSRIDPWSVAKVSFLLSVALGIVTFVAVLITWSVLGAAGVWDSLNSVVASVASTSDGSSAFDIEDYVGTGRILGLTLIVSVVNVVLLTAMATLAAYLYNMAAALLGGVEVTLSEGND